MTILNFQPGDMIGFSHRGAVGYGINLATLGIPGWGLSHIAMVAAHPGDPLRMVLFESTMLAPDPCLLARHHVAGVQCQEIANRIAGYPGRVWHYPLLRPLSRVHGQQFQLTEWWVERLGTAYDASGAIHSQDMRWWEREEDLSSLFCSEAVAAAWRAVKVCVACGKSASGWSPNALGRAVLNQSICLYPRRMK